ncbi:MAG: hypothetical protein COA43_10580 [Robiginitomaculum sp.]|nr:MAG: hypothetical protein COA43_10580 [Robiginitomaculum sp.]
MWFNLALLRAPTAALALMTFSACTTLSAHQGPNFGPTDDNTQITNQRSSQFEHPRFVDAQQFLGPKWMKSDLHTVTPKAYNDGYANSYEITTPHHTYTVQGTQETRKRIFEIEATERLRKTYTGEAIVKSLKDRTTNLVTTPYRAAISGKQRYDNIQQQGVDVKSVSSGLGAIVGKLGHGIKEFGVTGVRIVSSAGGTKCSALNCAAKAGKDIWSGFNSIVGKHAAAKRMHQRLGTDPYTDNKVLQKEVSRLAYAESYTGTGFKFGVSGAGISIISPLATGVGYYNNAEFAAQYEDAHKRRNIEKKLLAEWGANPSQMNTLYRNTSFSHTDRSRMMMILSEIGNANMRARLAEQIANTPTRFVAQTQLDIFSHIAKLDKSGQISGYVKDTPMVIAVQNGDTLILPFSADYLLWTPEIASAVENYAKLTGVNTPFKHAKIHILGQASPRFKSNAKKRGILVTVFAK